METVIMGPEHRPAVVEMMALLQDHEARIFPDREDGRAIATGHIAYLERCCAGHDGAIFVAVEAGNAVGFVVCHTGSFEEGDEHILVRHRTYGEVTDLFVHEAFRGRGVAAALMRRAEEHLAAVGVADIQVMALAANASALRFYHSLGYGDYEVILRKKL